jgi:hypothetical protein
MPFGYVSPGDAFSSSLENALVQRELMRQRQVESDLAVQREQREAANQAEERRQAQEALDEKRRAFDESRTDKERSQFEKDVTSMVPGDIPSPDLLQKAQKFGYGHLFPADKDAVVNALPTPAGIAADPDAQPGPMPQPVPQAPLPQPFVGTPVQRKAVADKQAILDMASTLPEGSPERKALEYEAHTGKNAPAGMFKEPGVGDGTAVARVDPRRQIVQRLVNGQWVDQTGDVPKGTHFLQEPDPAVAAAAAANHKAAADAKVSAAAERSRQEAFKDLDSLGKPLQSQLDEYEKVGTALNQRTAQADNDLAPLILKATVGGMGSGFRMTEAEINKTMGAGTKWEALERSLNKWSTDPQHFVFPEEQRTAMRNLAKAIRAKTYAQHRKVQDMRYRIAESDDPKEILRLRTELRDTLAPSDEESALNDTQAVPAGSKPAIRYGADMKPVVKQ